MLNDTATGNTDENTESAANYWMNWAKEGYLQVFEGNRIMTYSDTIELSTFNDGRLYYDQKSLELSQIIENQRD